MGSIRRQSDFEAQTQNATSSRRPTLRRLLSTDSTVSSIRLSLFDLSASPPQQKYSLCSSEFLLKILQLVIAVICAGLYSDGIRLMQHSLESKMFPNIVFSAFIIITSVIALSYVLGYVMHQILIRIFNIVGMTLYFVSACVSILDWYEFGRLKDEPRDIISARMLLAQACLSLLNVGLYGCDLYLSVKKAFSV